MSSFQIFVVLPGPESQHVHPPHCHHAWTVGFADCVALTEVEETVPRERLGVFVDEVRFLTRGEFT